MTPHPPADGTRVTQVSASIAAGYLIEPPAWTRLEPQSVSGDPRPGLEARIHDPLWMLTRQWQLGEFQGEDAGSPIAVHVSGTSWPIDAWQPGDPAASRDVRAWSAGRSLEETVERERTPAGGLGLRQRAEAGAQLLNMLDDVGLGDLRSAVVAANPLLFGGPDDPFDTSAMGLVAALAGRLPDSETLASTLAASLATDPPTLPDWLAGAADPAAALSVAQEWLDWYRGQVAPGIDPDGDCWIEERLEYRFSLGLGDASARVGLRAPSFEGGRIDWYAFDRDPRSLMPPAGAPLGDPERRDTTVWATPLRFAGMPAARYWQFEDGQVNLGALEAQPHDLARLLLVEFAMVYGNDWLVVPFDVPFGSFVTLDNVAYRTTFGEVFTVAAADDRGRTGRFRLFEIAEQDSDAAAPGLFVPPVDIANLEGATREEVLFLRDEIANMVWGVERTIEAPSGDTRTRSVEPRPTPIAPRAEPGADLDYLLQTRVPPNWIPFLPAPGGRLQKGAMVVDGAQIEPRGVLLRPGAPLALRDEEVPREGVRVHRRPILARRADGTYARWMSRRVSLGGGEGASGLAFDSAIERPPTE